MSLDRRTFTLAAVSAVGGALLWPLRAEADARYTTRATSLLDEPGGSSLGRLPAGLSVSVLERSGTWTRIRVGALRGWVPTERLATTTSVSDPFAALPTLRSGSTDREHVMLIQRTVGVRADGVFGAQTSAALVQWKLFNGLSESPVVGHGTWRTTLTNHDGASPYAYPFVSTITPVRGGQSLTRGRNGVKVKLVQRALGFSAGTFETYDQATIDAVMAFQRRKGLAVDGVVGPRTWAALGTGYDWASVDTYQATPQLPTSGVSTSRRIETMIDYALNQRGAEYVWGGAGPKRLGFDCSGLVLQALYAAGIDEQPIDVIEHSGRYQRTSQYLYNNVRTKKYPIAERRRGDLVFWRDAASIVRHVAIYLGAGQIVEAVEPTVIVNTYRSTRGTRHVAPYVVRPIR